MLLSIIIPVYNAEKYLEICLKSCLDQDYDNYEIVCINDGSKDSSAMVLEQYALSNSKVKVITQDNSGVSVARNNGISHAEGKYIWFIDADDYIEKKCIPKMLAIAEENELDLLAFGHLMVEDDVLPKCVCRDHNLTARLFDENAGEQVQKCYESQQHSGFVWKYIVKKDIIDKHHIHFVENAIMCEDIDFNFYLYNVVQRAAYIDSNLYFYRRSSTSASRNLDTKRYIRSRITMAVDHKKKLKLYDGKIYRALQDKILYDVQGSINMAISLGDVKYLKSIISELKEKGLYPYKMPVKALIPHSGVKKYLIDVISMFYPLECVPILLANILSLKKR